jgi:hypothetical protein
MRLVKQNGEWRIEGPGSDRAVVAFASLENDQLTYRVLGPSGRAPAPPASEFLPASLV